MKILIVQDFLRNGGTERQSVLLANAWAAVGHPTTLLTFRPGGALAGTAAKNVSRRTLQPFDVGLDWLAPGLIAAARQIAPDIIVCMGRMANCYGASLQNGLPSSRVIATMRTGKPLPALFRRSLQRVGHVVANSAEARDALVSRYFVSRQKISVIHNSLIFPPVSALRRNDTLRAHYGATDSTNVLLCVAMFRPEKNQRELVEIVAGLPTSCDWQLWLAGDGSARAACEDLVSSKKLGSRVKFTGFHVNPSALYCAADLAVHASWSEALSNFLIEAQAHGLPAVAYQAQGIEECFIPGQTGRAIARNDRMAFRSELLRHFGSGAAERTAISAKARAFARETFDPERQVAAYLNLFSQIVAP